MKHSTKKPTCPEANKKGKNSKTDCISNPITSLNQNMTLNNNSLNMNKQFQRLRDDIIEYQNKQSKFQKEIQILNQKLQDANSFLFNHKGHHKKNVASLHLNLIKEKQLNEKEEKELKLNKKLANELCTSYDILLDVVEILLAAKHISPSSPNYTYRDIKNDNASFSIDIYENNSINNDDDKRTALIEQIQSVLLFKFNFLHSSFMFPLEKQISRIKAWNYTQKGGSNVSSMSFASNLSNLKNKIQLANNANNTSISSFANSNIHSPKFFRDESPGSNKDGQCSNLIMNESIIKEIAQNDSFALDDESRMRAQSNMNLIQVFEEMKSRENEEENTNPKQGFNIINTSFKDMSVKINDEAINKKIKNDSSYNDDSKECEARASKDNLSKSLQHKPSVKIVFSYFLPFSLLLINLSFHLMIYRNQN